MVYSGTIQHLDLHLTVYPIGDVPTYHDLQNLLCHEATGRHSSTKPPKQQSFKHTMVESDLPYSFLGTPLYQTVLLKMHFAFHFKKLQLISSLILCSLFHTGPFVLLGHKLLENEILNCSVCSLYIFILQCLPSAYECRNS